MRKIVYEPLIKDCVVCGNKFEARQRNQTCCSKRCKGKRDYAKHSESYKKRNKDWYVKNLKAAKSRRKKYYHADPEHWKAKAKEWRLLNKKKKSENDQEYIDRIRHAGKRQELINEHGYVCFNCGKETNSFGIVAHHSRFDPTDHEHQELLCRSCHCIIHHWS